MNDNYTDPIKTIQALENQMRVLSDKVESLAGSTLSKEEALALHQNLVTVHNGIVNEFKTTQEHNVSIEKESLRLAIEGSEQAIQKEMSDVREDFQRATREIVATTAEVRDTTWVKRAYMGIAGATVLGLFLVLGSYAMTSRHMNITSKQEELARLEKAIVDNSAIIEKQRLEYNGLQSNIERLALEADVIARINSGIEYTKAIGGGVEIYLKEGWGTERCELADGSSARRCIRRD